jgi:hypothetical protein
MVTDLAGFSETLTMQAATASLHLLTAPVAAAVVHVTVCTEGYHATVVKTRGRKPRQPGLAAMPGRLSLSDLCCCVLSCSAPCSGY